MKKLISCMTMASALLLACVVRADVTTPSVDPWEGYNRAVFRFNDGFDRAILKPVAKGYKAVMPDFAEQGVSNVFSNLGEISNILNGLLQAKFSQAGKDTGRFVINSTIGIAGLFDVAGHAGLAKGDGEDFGQTLGYWGVNSGPFVVLPFFGPKTLRDAGAFPVDWYTDPVNHIEDDATRWGIRAVDIIQTRANLLEADKLISGDKYTFIRDAYLQRREFLIHGPEQEDDFGLEDSEYGDF